MASRITLYDKTGHCVAEVDATVKRSWILNRYGVASFSMSTQDPKCRREFLEFGNYILIEHEDLPAWCGVIATPRKWKQGVVIIAAVSAEWIFTRRRGQDGKTWNSYCGPNFKELVHFANNAGDTRIRAGEVYEHGNNYTLSLTYGSKLYDDITKMSDFYHHEWDVTHDFDSNGLLIFYGNWYVKRSFMRDTALEEGNNIEMVDELMSEQGEIINDYRFTGSGINSADKSTSTVVDQDSIARYGLTQKAETGDAEDIIGNVEENAVTRLAKLKEPRRTFNFKVLDVGTVWKEVRLGALFPVKLHTVGFSGSGFGTFTTVRITGVVFDDLGRLEITCEESI